MTDTDMREMRRLSAKLWFFQEEIISPLVVEHKRSKKGMLMK